MLRIINDLKKCTIAAADGDIGAVQDIYFEDEGWTVRFLVVDTGRWLSGRRVLTSPLSFGTKEHEPKRLFANLTKEKVRNSPDVNSALPISRQHEVAFSRYYGHTPYWEGPYRWGGAPLPGFWAEGGNWPDPLVAPRRPDAVEREIAARLEQSMDPYLRSAREVIDYHIQAADGEIGHVEELLVDDHDWTIRYMVVDTRNWWPGKKVLISPAWADRISYDDSKVYVGLTREAIQNAPEDDPDSLDQAYEIKLFTHYGKPLYWEEPPEFSWKIFPPGPPS